MFSIEDFIIFVFCCTDDNFRELSGGQKIRRSGFPPALTDSELIAMEIVGEFLGIDADKGIWEYFRRHWLHFFPCIGSRTTFVRQSANLWHWKQKLQKKFAEKLSAFSDNIHMADGFPIPVCRFRRAFFSKNFRGDAAYGRCASKDEKYYGFRGHLLISFSGAVTNFSLTPANVDERDVLPELLPDIHGLVIGDKGYIRACLREELLSCGIDLQTPFRSNMKDERDPESVRMLISVRRKIETVIGQLSERFGIEKVRARDKWHMMSRITRKLLSHTVGLYINHLLGREILQLDGLIAS